MASDACGALLIFNIGYKFCAYRMHKFEKIFFAITVGVDLSLAC